MDLLRELTINNLKLNKKRSFMTILGITLSVALIFTVITMVTSLLETMRVTAIEESGNYHIKTNKVDKLQTLEANRDVKNIGKISTLGYGKLNKSAGLKTYLAVRALDEMAFDQSTINITQGRLPENPNEIAVFEGAKYFALEKFELNQEVKLSLYNRYLDGKPYNDYPDDQEYLDEKKDYTFKVVGIFDKYSSNILNYQFMGYPILTKHNLDSSYYINELYYKLVDASKLNEHVRNIYDREIKLGITDSVLDINRNLLRYEGNLSDTMQLALYGAATVISVMIVATSIMVIRNSFAISIVEKSKQYGILKSLGATDKQIRKDIIFEGFALGIIGILAGLVLGILVNLGLVYIINYLLKETIATSTFKLMISPMGTAISIVLSIITIYLSSLFTALKVKNQSPIESIRGSKDINIKESDVKTPSYIDKIFGFAGLVSYKNLRRSRKKFRTTVISIILSVSIFIGMYSVVKHIESLSQVQFDTISATLVSENFTNEDSYSDRYSIYKKMIKDLNITDDYTVSKSFFASSKDHSHMINIIDEKAFNRLLKINNLSEDSKYLMQDSYVSWEDDKKVLKKDVLPEKLDLMYEEFEIKSSHDGQDDIMEIIDVKNFTFNITPITTAPVGFSSYASDSPQTIFIKEGTLNEEGITFNPPKFAIDTKDDIQLERKINDYIAVNGLAGVKVYNLMKDIRMSRSLVLIVQLFIYGFIIVITAIGLTNIFNTVTANMISRRIEFASLSSVGMRAIDFDKMIRLESLFLGTRALLFGIPLGLIFSYLFHHYISMAFEAPYKLPVLAVAISVVFVFIIIWVIMSYSLSKIRGLNIVETIRNENI